MHDKVDSPAHDAAIAALSKLGSYAARNAEAIAKAAVDAPDPATGEARVRALVGHTTTGARNVQKWTKVARNAAQRAGGGV
jgi:hypothetical protein